MPRGSAATDPSPAPPDGARPPRRRAILAAAVATTFVLVATVRPGDPQVLEQTGHLCLVCGRIGGADVVRNVLLFLPLGAALAALGLPLGRAVALGAGLSLLVEALQMLVLPGRSATLSDLLTNSTGTALGWFVVAWWPHLWRPAPQLARRLAVAGFVGWAAAAAGGAWAVTPLPAGRDAWLMRIPPGPRVVRAFEGEVLSATLNGHPVGLGSPYSTPQRRIGIAPPLPPELALEPPLRLAAEVHAMYPPGMLRPIVFGYGPRPAWPEIVLLGQRQRGLHFRIRTRSRLLRLPSPTYVLRDAFPATGGSAGSTRATGEIVRLGGELADGRVSLRAEHGGVERRFTARLSPYVAWSLVLAPLAVDDVGLVIGAVYLALLALPAAFWGARAGWRAALPALALAGAAVLVVVPWLAGLPLPAWWEWLAAAAGIGVGWLLGRRRVARA